MQLADRGPPFLHHNIGRLTDKHDGESHLSHTRSGFPLFLSHTRVPAGWKDTNEQPHIDHRRRCNFKITSPCRISAYAGFSGSPVHVFQ